MKIFKFDGYIRKIKGRYYIYFSPEKTYSHYYVPTLKTNYIAKKYLSRPTRPIL